MLGPSILCEQPRTPHIGTKLQTLVALQYIGLSSDYTSVRHQQEANKLIQTRLRRVFALMSMSLIDAHGISGMHLVPLEAAKSE